MLFCRVETPRKFIGRFYADTNQHTGGQGEFPGCRWLPRRAYLQGKLYVGCISCIQWLLVDLLATIGNKYSYICLENRNEFI